MTVVAYCTPADVRAYGRLNITSDDDDEVLSNIIDTVSLRIDQMHNLPVGGYAVSADTTRYYQYTDIHRGRLQLDMACLSVTTLVNGDASPIPAQAFRLHPRNEERKWFIELLTGWAWGIITDGEIVVTGKFGYSLTPPPNVVEAAAMWSGSILKRYQAALQDTSVNVELGQLIYSAPIPSQVIALLQPQGPML
jgi:hypothetical protein